MIGGLIASDLIANRKRNCCAGLSILNFGLCFLDNGILDGWWGAEFRQDK